jgi:hypothetical protein
LQGTLTLQIAHNRTTLAMPSHSASKICYDLTLGDVKPPDGIETLHLEGVCIQVNVSNLSSTPKQYEDEWFDDFPENDVLECTFDDLLRSDLLEASLLFRPFPSSMVVSSPHDGVPSSCKTLSNIPLASADSKKDEDMPDESAKDIMLLESESLGIALHSVADGLEWEVKEYPDKVEGRDQSLYPFLSLLDTILKLTLHNQPKISLDIVVIEDSIQPRLSEVAPAMWNPGYLLVR